MTNEAAERLREMFEGFSDPDVMHADLDAALAAERAVGVTEGRQATVERIRAAYRKTDSYRLDEHGRNLDAILDAESAR